MAVGEDPTFGTSSTIGRYFGVVSMVPSVILTAWVYLLLLLKPWAQQPDITGIVSFNLVSSWGQVIALLVGAVGFAVVTHPVQLLIIQALEGYWGTSSVARAWATRRTMSHLRARDRLERSAVSAENRAKQLQQRHGMSEGDLLADDSLNTEEASQILHDLVTISSMSGALDRYPSQLSQFMPTRLGNVLRKYEMDAGSAVGLSVITWAAHIGMVADPAHTAHVDDQRQQLDLAAKMTSVGLLCTVLTLCAMWPHGLWCLLAIIPFGASWLSYQGAIAAADSYGQAFSAWLHLNRFALYERLGLPKPRNSIEERELTDMLNVLYVGSSAYAQEYSHPASATQRPRPNLHPTRTVFAKRRRSASGAS